MGRNSNYSTSTVRGCEDNLTLWRIVRLEENQIGCDPFDAILKLREICHLPRPNQDDIINTTVVEIPSLNDSILSSVSMSE